MCRHSPRYIEPAASKVCLTITGCHKFLHASNCLFCRAGNFAYVPLRENNRPAYSARHAKTPNPSFSAPRFHFPRGQLEPGAEHNIRLPPDARLNQSPHSVPAIETLSAFRYVLTALLSARKPILRVQTLQKRPPICLCDGGNHSKQQESLSGQQAAIIDPKSCGEERQNH